MLIIDDYLKNIEEALSETIRRKIYQTYLSTSNTRLTPDGAVVIIATRWHAKDLIGLILDEAGITGETWEHIRMPAVSEAGEALWPEQFSRRWMDEKKASYAASGYPWMWEALYQGNPPTVLDAEFDPSLFGESVMFDEWPSPDDVRFRVIALDPSMGKSNKSDYSSFAIMYLANNGTIYVDVDMDRRDPWTITDAACRLYNQHKPHRICIESNGFQEVLAGMLEERSKKLGLMMPITTFNSDEDKKIRIRRDIGPYLHRREFRFNAKAAGWRCAWINSALSRTANSTTGRMPFRWV